MGFQVQGLGFRIRRLAAGFFNRWEACFEDEAKALRFYKAMQKTSSEPILITKLLSDLWFAGGLGYLGYLEFRV